MGGWLILADKEMKKVLRKAESFAFHAKGLLDNEAWGKKKIRKALMRRKTFVTRQVQEEQGGKA
ncbi:hypothetical protein, partial [Bartonella queenslandensis]|uniref:hypothetical protein n=1 Tax=Bartonella queenslandensis TaxID=481138 RepID=UPI000584EA70